MRWIAALLGLVILFAPVSPLSAQEPKIVAFTFDDGPRPEFLEKALPYLEKEKIPATFFVVGRKAQKYPDWIRRAHREAHEIENHTMNHLCLVRPNPTWTACNNLSKEAAIQEIASAMEVILGLIGYRTKFLRPPHFAMTAERKRDIEQALNIRVLEHGSNSIGSLDWVYRDPAKVVRQVVETAKRRPDVSYVIVFHENDVTLKALPEIVRFFRSRGYQFVTLDEFVRLNPKARI